MIPNVLQCSELLSSILCPEWREQFRQMRQEWYKMTSVSDKELSTENDDVIMALNQPWMKLWIQLSDFSSCCFALSWLPAALSLTMSTTHSKWHQQMSVLPSAIVHCYRIIVSSFLGSVSLLVRGTQFCIHSSQCHIETVSIQSLLSLNPAQLFVRHLHLLIDWLSVLL